jgi:hypothetical protein
MAVTGSGEEAGAGGGVAAEIGGWGRGMCRGGVGGVRQRERGEGERERGGERSGEESRGRWRAAATRRQAACVTGMGCDAKFGAE